MLFSHVAALQQRSTPLARFYIDGSAATADRDHGSGETCCHVPGHWPVNDIFGLISQDTYCFHEPTGQGTIRYGEALHPGPHLGDTLTVGVSNPGGLRQKEDLLLGFGPGHLVSDRDTAVSHNVQDMLGHFEASSSSTESRDPFSWRCTSTIETRLHVGREMVWGGHPF